MVSGDDCQDVAAIVHQAYETLKDKNKRRLYNEELQAALNYAYESTTCEHYFDGIVLHCQSFFYYYFVSSIMN